MSSRSTPRSREGEPERPGNLPDEIVVRGRGGTDFRPGFEWLNAQDIQPTVSLYFTDLKCSDYPETEPDFPVLWMNYSEPPSES